MPIPAPPRIVKLRRKMKTIERRMAHLAKRIEDPGRGVAASDYDRAELEALRAGLECMGYVDNVHAAEAAA